MISDEECEIIEVVSCMQPSGSVSHQSKTSSSTVQPFVCPMCPYTSEETSVLEVHVNEHFNPTGSVASSQSSFDAMVYSCPLCDEVFAKAPLLESHFHSVHESEESTSHSSEMRIAGLFCPVCSSHDFPCAEVLERHINEHFAVNELLVDDEKMARSLETEERKAMEIKEREEFKRLQAQYGFEKGKNIARQGDANLFRSVEQGKMSAAEYHEKRIMLKFSERNGIDDGASATRNITAHLKKLSAISGTMWICSPVDHYSSSFGDKGWGCGYRNLQMMLSSLLRSPQYSERLKKLCPPTTSPQDSNINVPSITRIQSAIEEAWKSGFDLQGCDQLGGKLSDTCKWIGATEIAALFASYRIRCRLIDFHQPTSTDGKHHALFEWVKTYFLKPSEFKPPLYFQHQGHSRTIVGIEEMKQSSLLILDPSHKPDKNKGILKKDVWVSMASLKAKQYQLVCVDSGFLDDEQEFKQSRVLRSTRIP